MFKQKLTLLLMLFLVCAGLTAASPAGKNTSNIVIKKIEAAVSSNKITNMEAEITYLNGLVHIKRHNATTENWIQVILTTDAPLPELFVGDTIKTGAQSKAELKFANGNVIRMAEQSILTIKEAKIIPAVKRQRTILDLLKGKIWNNITTKLKETDTYYKVQTPVAVAVVKGTIFDVSMAAESCEIRVFKGLVEASNSFGSILIPANNNTILTSRTPPTPPRSLPSGSDQEWIWRKPPPAAGGRTETPPEEGAAQSTDGSSTSTPAKTDVQADTPQGQAKKKLAQQAKKAILSQKDKKSPSWAALQSLLIPGLGEIYSGQYIKGLAYALVEGASIYMAVQSNNEASEYYARASEARENDSWNQAAYYEEEASLFEQKTQTYTIIAVGLALMAAWDSAQEANAYNQSRDNSKLSIQIQKDLGLAVSYSHSF
ncbi:FecR domain-containing protein [Candidatus Margulisiibacteriota bacterium]